MVHSDYLLSTRNDYLYYYKYIIYVIVYIKMLPTIRVTIYSCMMEEIRIPSHKQIVQLNIYQIHMEVWYKMKSIELGNDKYVF